MSDWLSTIVATFALLISILTAAATFFESRRTSRTADLTAYFHRNLPAARVDLPDRRIKAGYNLVIWNQGPATASKVDFDVRRPGQGPAPLATIEPGELPVARIDGGGKYPVQFVPDLAEFYDQENNPLLRRFDVVLRWEDGNGRHEKLIPLRRGQTDR
jgi:hypothetical protein